MKNGEMSWISGGGRESVHPARLPDRHHLAPGAAEHRPDDREAWLTGSKTPIGEPRRRSPDLKLPAREPASGLMPAGQHHASRREARGAPRPRSAKAPRVIGNEFDASVRAHDFAHRLDRQDVWIRPARRGAGPPGS